MIEKIGEKFEAKRDEIRKELPDKLEFVKCYIYKQGKCLAEFMLNEYERYVEKFIDPKVCPVKAVLKNTFIENVSKSGYGVEMELDHKKFDPRWESFTKKHVKLEEEFKNELLSLYKVKDHPKIDDIWAYSNTYVIKQGGFNTIEEYFIQLLVLLDIIPKESKEDKK